MFAWIAYGFALYAPATSMVPGYYCLLGTVAEIFVLFTKGTADPYLICLVFPNLIMFLSPLALSPSVRRGRLMNFLTFGAVLGALIAASFPVSLLIRPLPVPECGVSTPTYFKPEIGTWLWVASQALLLTGIVIARKSRQRASRPTPEPA